MAENQEVEGLAQGIAFFNIRTGEKRVADTEPMLSALFNSSNLHVNAMVGQDFGWRLAPETIKQINDIKRNPMTMNQIAMQFMLPLDNVGDTAILQWIAYQNALQQQAEQEESTSDYSQQYEQELRAIEAGDRAQGDPNPSQPMQPPTQPRQEDRNIGNMTQPPAEPESLEELQERTDAARRANEPTPEEKAEQEKKEEQNARDLLGEENGQSAPTPDENFDTAPAKSDSNTQGGGAKIEESNANDHKES